MDSVDAYAKLQGKEDAWYVTSLPFVFGRKSEKHSENFLDITMGAGTKTISREHAVLSYSDEKKAYILEVKGKSGCYVNKKHIIRGERCCLYNKDTVEMVQCKFYFLLPKQEGSSNEEVKPLKREDENSSVQQPSKRQEVADAS